MIRSVGSRDMDEGARRGDPARFPVLGRRTGERRAEKSVKLRAPGF
jgi:hypothetical protein